jgi:hypothetical protein
MCFANLSITSRRIGRTALRLATLPCAISYDEHVAEAGRRNPDWEWDEIVLARGIVADDSQLIGKPDVLKDRRRQANGRQG